MSALEFLATLRRRWYVLALVALCTMAAVLAVHKRTIVYEACGGFYVSGPNREWMGNPYDVGNTYLDTSTATPMVTGMVVQTVMSPTVQQKIHSQGVSDYVVAQTNTGEVRFPTYTQPTMEVCANSTSVRSVMAAAQIVTANLRAELRQMQAAQHIKQNLYIRIINLFPAYPIPILGHSSLAYAGVMLFGIVSGVALTLWSDQWLTRWDRRRRGYGLRG